MNNLTPLFYRMTKILLYGKKGNCLSLGPGDGYAEIQLIKNNWNVTGVDIDKKSYELMKKKTNTKKLEFIHTDFKLLKLNKKYDYIIAINSIPYMDKKYLDELMSNIVNHSNKNCIFTITFFSKKTTYVINKICFGMSITTIKKLFKKYNIEIKLIDQYSSKNEKGHLFDVIGVIGKKN